LGICTNFRSSACVAGDINNVTIMYTADFDNFILGSLSSINGHSKNATHHQ